jgi:hypothetical protein
VYNGNGKKSDAIFEFRTDKNFGILEDRRANLKTCLID